MSHIYSYVRVNENNEFYTQKQKSSISKYIDKHNISIYKSFEIDISNSSEEKNILELLKNIEKKIYTYRFRFKCIWKNY